MKKKRLPRPDLYDLRRWCHASNVARRDAWNGCTDGKQRAKPVAGFGNKGMRIVCIETGQDWPTLRELRKHLRCRDHLIRAAIKSGDAIDGRHYRRAS